MSDSFLKDLGPTTETCPRRRVIVTGGRHGERACVPGAATPLVRRGWRPTRLEVGGLATTELHVGAEPAVVRIDVEVEERRMTEMQVRAVAVTACDVDEPVDDAKRFDQLCVRHSFITVRPVLRQRRTWPRTSMSIAPVLASRHGGGLRPATVCRPRFFRVLPHISA